MTIDTSSTQAAFLVVSQSYFPGWQARVDGQPEQLLVADYLFQGIHLPAGSHHIQLDYEPSNLRTGEYISSAALAAWLLFVAAIVFGTLLRRRRPGTVQEVESEA